MIEEYPHFEQIARFLRILGLRAEAVDTGGGIECIKVDVGDDTALYFGTANITWGASVDIRGEYAGMEVETDCLSEQPNVTVVAGAIYRATKDFLIGAAQ